MANHGFVTTRRKLTVERVDKDIREIVERRFKGLASVKLENFGPPKDEHERWAMWDFTVPCTEDLKRGRFPWGFEIWFTTPHKLEFRHSFTGSQDWCSWAQCCVMEEELAKLYNGWVSDEGVDNRWRGKPEKYPTFQSWLDILYSPRVDDFKHKAACELLKKTVWMSLPPLLKKLG